MKLKKNNKKGFTIVELVIVIAVIAILAAVLIPTFSGLVEKANKSSAMQAARNEYEAYLAEYAKDLSGTESYIIVTDKYAFEVKEGQFDETALDKSTTGHTGTVDLTQIFVKSAAEASEEGCYTYENGVYTEAAENHPAGDYYKVDADKDLGSAKVEIYVK